MNNRVPSLYGSLLPSELGPADRSSHTSGYLRTTPILNPVVSDRRDRTGFNDQTQNQLDFVFKAIDSAEPNLQNFDLDLVEESDVKCLLDLMDRPRSSAIQTCLPTVPSLLYENVSQDLSFGSVNPNDRSFVGLLRNPALIDSVLREDHQSGLSDEESAILAGLHDQSRSFVQPGRQAETPHSSTFMTGLGKHSFEDFTREHLTETSPVPPKSNKRVKFNLY